MNKIFPIKMLATLLGTTNFAQVLTPPQMITLTMVAMFYISGVTTIAAFWKQFVWKKAAAVTLFKTFFAIGLGGIVFRVLTIFGKYGNASIKKKLNSGAIVLPNREN